MAIRAGIVGTGWGANHARVLAELAPQFRVTALCSRRRERPLALAVELDLPPSVVETEWERLVARDDVDLVIVTTPDDLHHPITLAAAQSGKHVFCDKPLALDTYQADEMLAAVRAAGVAHFTGFTWRFTPMGATFKRVVDAGQLGAVHHVDGHFRIGPPLPGKEWQLEPDHRRGAVFSNLMIHLLDLVTYLTGTSTRDLTGWRVWGHGDGTGIGGAHQSAWVQLERQDGSLRARLQTSQLTALRAADPVRIEVHGTEASAVGYANALNPHTQRVALVPETSAEPKPVEPMEYPGGPPAPPTAALPSGGILRPTIRHLYEEHVLPRIADGRSRPDTPTFEDGLAAQRLLDAALESATTGQWVVL